MTDRIGKVWLVGAGPNDPGLLTIKGKAMLERAEVVVYDHLVSTGILAMIPKETKKINVGKISETIRYRRMRSIKFWWMRHCAGNGLSD